MTLRDLGVPAVSSNRDRAFPDGPPAWPGPDDEVREALEQLARDGGWGKYEGPRHEELIERLQAEFAVPLALPCCSGTLAVELALRAAGISEGDEVVLAGYDFPGNFRAIEAVGARPVLVDLAPDTWHLDIEFVAAALEPATRAILVSHLHGVLAPMARFRELADARQICLIEDACQVPGARVDGRPAGSWGDVGVLSFGGSKLLSAGRGGAILTSRPDFHQRAKVFCERGNQTFPLSELQAAVLLPQLRRLAERHVIRGARCRQLCQSLADVAALGAPASTRPDDDPAYYKLAWFWDSNAAGGASRESFLSAVRAEGLALDAGFRGFALRSSHRCRKPFDLPHSRRGADETVLLHHPLLLQSAHVIELAARTIRDVVERVRG